MVKIIVKKYSLPNLDASTKAVVLVTLPAYIAWAIMGFFST